MTPDTYTTCSLISFCLCVVVVTLACEPPVHRKPTNPVATAQEQKPPPVPLCDDPASIEGPCADFDADEDGIANARDACVLQAEDVDQFEDADGCPDMDNDGDGWLDREDACPDKPELINGVEDEDGCPDEGAPSVVLHNDRIELLEPVVFEYDKPVIKPKSYGVLKQVATMLQRNPELHVRIEGHRDPNPDWDRPRGATEITKTRAQSVRKFLMDHGVEAERLEAQGYGPDKPIASNKTREGRAQNRRIELHLTHK